MDSTDMCFIITALCNYDYTTMSGKVPCLLSSHFFMMLAMLYSTMCWLYLEASTG